MLKSTLCLGLIAVSLSGCNAFRSEAETREILIGDCQNGAVMNQATFGGPLRCGPQSEGVFTVATPDPES